MIEQISRDGCSRPDLELGLGDRVAFGHVPAADLPAFISWERSFSSFLPNTRVSWSARKLEALSMECPVIAPSNSSLPEVSG